jgi:heat shock protein HslJ
MRQYLATSISRGGEELGLVTPPPDTIEITGLRVEFGEWCRGGFFAGCNRHGWIWTIADGRLRIDGIDSTIVGCNADLAGQDTWLAQFFESDPFIRVTREEVVLESGDTVIRLRERRR